MARERRNEDFGMNEAMSPAEISRMIADNIAAEVARTVRCDAHGERPAITIVHAEPDGLEYAITGCCEDLRKKARSSIDGLLGSGVI